MEIEELYNIISIAKESGGENSWIEFKSGRLKSNELIGEYISALSNGATIANKPYGFMIWGISDDLEIIGTKFNFKKTKEGNQEVELWLRNLLSPKISFSIHELQINNQNLVVLRIPSAQGEPTYFKNKAFIRIGSSKTDLQKYPDYIRYIYNSQSDWSAQIVAGSTLDDLDPEALSLAKVKFLERNKKYEDEINSWDNVTFLNKAKITNNGFITNTALLLLGKDDSAFKLSPVTPSIIWKLDSEEKSYEHFSIPWLLSTTKVLNQIRNIKYKFFPDNELLSTTVNKYETRVILEALHNCIAHQNYLLNSRINVIEKTDKLIFENAGSFYEGNPDEYFLGEKTPQRYRNPHLVQAMVNLGMIDTMGYGIHSMLIEQSKRFFPLPEFDIENPDKVILTIYGHSIDDNYTKLLLQKSDLSLSAIILLDRVQKGMFIPDESAKFLKNLKLIEGRKPSYIINGNFAFTKEDKTSYIKNRGLNDSYYKEMIIAYLSKYKDGSRADIEKLLMDKLSDLLTAQQKKDKVKNLLQSLKSEERIKVKNKVWSIA